MWFWHYRLKVNVKKDQVTVEVNQAPEHGTDLTPSVDQGVVYEEPDIKGQYGMEISSAEKHTIKVSIKIILGIM